LSEKSLHEARHWLPVIDMAWRQPKRQEFSCIIHDEMQFETIKPAHGGLAPSCNVLKDPVRRNTVIVTDGKRRRVDEGNPHTAAFVHMEITT